MKRLLPVYQNKTSPCFSRDHLGNHGCYARNDIPRFLNLVRLGRFQEAFYVLKKTNPFSSGCGRFCDHPCETACNRTKYDESVDIRALERFVSDWGYAAGLKPEKLRESSGKSVAVIGAGPAGLATAYFLALHGHRVVVHEQHEEPGGLLTEGIPAYRYPRDVFAQELAFLQSAGVEILTGYTVNRDKFINLASEYDAVVVATGAHKPVELNIEGETLPGVQHGISFLREANFGRAENLGIKAGERIAVIGGGYTAIDVARVAVRLGAKPEVIYRRTVGEMTAHQGEVEDTKREGVTFRFLRSPLRFEKKGNELIVHTQVMKLGPADESGRARPIPALGVTEALPFDRIVLAIGDRPDLYFVGQSFSIDFPRMLCPELPEDLRSKIFIAGDAAMGKVENTGMVVRVVGMAQDTAKGVRAYLGDAVDTDATRDIAYYNGLNLKYFEHSSRLVEDELPHAERVGNFAEVVSTIDENRAVLMASRCFNCGICIQCDWCYTYSGGSIVKLTRDWTPEKDAFFYQFITEHLGDESYRAVAACPRSAMAVVKDGERGCELCGEQYISEEELTGGDK